MKNIVRAMFGVAFFLASLTAGAVPPDKVPIQDDFVGAYIADCGAFNILIDESGFEEEVLDTLCELLTP